MADFIADTRVAQSETDPVSMTAELSPDWAVWGPNGGYLASIALRAAVAQSRCARPASFQCHFLAVGEFAPVTLQVRSMGGSKRAESLRVDMLQGERTLLAATVWMTDDDLAGYAHDHSVMPDVPKPADLEGYQDRADDYADWYPIWRSMEGRPVTWHDEPGEPISQTWLRFNESPIPDREADAVRQLFWLDYPGWNATIAAHGWPFAYLAPNLDLTVQFHAFAPEVDWMLADGIVPVAGDGLVGCMSRLWTEDGRLLATGTSKHICRPNPMYAADLERAREQGDLPDDT